MEQIKKSNQAKGKLNEDGLNIIGERSGSDSKEGSRKQHLNIRFTGSNVIQCNVLHWMMELGK